MKKESPLNMRLSILGYLIFISSCGPHYAKKPRQDLARAVINDTFEPVLGARVYSCEAPTKWWEIRCPSKPDVSLTAVVVNNICYSGLAAVRAIHVAWRGSFSSSAYAHEMWHYLSACTKRVGVNGIDDITKNTPAWCQVCVDAIDKANATLRQLGL